MKTFPRRHWSAPDFWRTMGLFGFCSSLPFIVVGYVQAGRRKSVRQVEAGGHSNRAQAEKESLKVLWQTLQSDQTTNLIRVRYIISIRLLNGLTGNRLALIGYNRESQTLMYSYTDPDLRTGFELPQKLESYSPVIIGDIAELVRVQGEVSDIRKLKSGIHYKIEIVSK